MHTNDSNVVLRGFELPERDVDGDAALALGLQLVQNPCYTGENDQGGSRLKQGARTYRT